jgi:hypothetical protein
MTVPPTDPRPLPPPLAPAPVVPLAYHTPPSLDRDLHASGIWREGNRMVVSLGYVGPDVCVKCNAPAEGYRWRKNVSWAHPAYIALFLVHPVVYLIVYFIVRKRMRVDMGMCPKHKSRGILFIVLAIVLIFGFLLGVPIALTLMHNPPNALIAALVGLMILGIFGGIVLVVLAPTLRPRRIDERFAWLSGAGPEFLATLPTSTA